MFELRNSYDTEKELLIKYKLSTIYEYAEDLSDEENQRILDYVNCSVSELLNVYKVIIVDSRIVGCLLVTDYEDGVMLDEIYLEEEYRGLGIGSSLIKSILDKHDVVYLWVYKKNDKAIKLYKKFGFRNIEETETRYLMKFEIEKN